MTDNDLLRRYGLFDAKVPRYTSYPPANHFIAGTGALHQRDFLAAVEADRPVSVYLHIPFCRRLCWFCACRTQGTRTMRPVEAYVDHVLEEIAQTRALLPEAVTMGRLHLGGGTPTILPPAVMARLLDGIFAAFPTAAPFEFSVEIDPTDAAPDLLHLLLARGMNRASIGVQDFAPQVQKAIGRPQSLAQTREVVDLLRDAGLRSLNIDLLYGLPYQTPASFRGTLDRVVAMQPDRLAIFGYAHVPWMSKRQVVIPEAALPGPERRFALAGMAHAILTGAGWQAIGIDHFARPTDTLAVAMAEGRVRRNFQGYTDDDSPVLIGFGASAISRFPGGYVQNAVATSAWQDRVARGMPTGDKGYLLTPRDRVVSQMVEDLMCRFALDPASLATQFPGDATFIAATLDRLAERFPLALEPERGVLRLRPAAQPLARIMAHHIDAFASARHGYSMAT